MTLDTLIIMSLDPKEAKRRSDEVTNSLMSRICLPNQSIMFGQTTARPIVNPPQWMNKPVDVKIQKPNFCKLK